MIKDIINSIFEKINNASGSLEKENFKEDILKLNDIFEDLLKDCKYPENRLMLRFNEDERLAQIENKINLFKDKPYIGIQEGVKICEQKIRNFLEYYHIGYCNSLFLGNYGSLDVTIGCLIHNHSSFHDKDESNKIKFQMQMDILKDYGFDLELKKNEAFLLGTENNIVLLKQLLSSFGCALIKIEVLGERKNMCIIDKISFKIKPSDLLDTNFSLPEISFKVSNELNPDEISSIISNFKELYSSYTTFMEMEGLRDNCGYIIQSLFAQICKTLNITTSISEKNNIEHSEIRRKNIEIREKEIELGQLISGEVIKEGMGLLYNHLNKIGYEKLGFRCSDLSISPHNINATFFIYRQKYCFENNIKRIKEDALKDIYDVIGSLEDESLNILLNDKNVETLNLLIKKHIPNGFISNLKIGNHWSIMNFYIESFEVSISNLNDLF